MTKRLLVSIVTALSLIASTVGLPTAAAAAETPQPVSGPTGPWTVFNVAQDSDAWTIESYKVDRDLIAWTSVNPDKSKRQLQAFDGTQTVLLATMSAKEWNDDSQFYDAVTGNYDVADGVVTWTQFDGNDREIWLWNGTETRKITDNSYDDKHPVTSRGSVAWTTVPNPSYALMVRDANGAVRRLDGWNVTNYAWSGANLYWLNMKNGENWFRVFRFNGKEVAPIGEGDDRPIRQYFTVDRNGSAGWEYSTKHWDYDKRVIYVSENGAAARRVIQRDVPPNITRVEAVRGGEVMLNSTDLLYSNLNSNVALIRSNGVQPDKYQIRKSVPSKARYVEGGIVRHLEPENTTPLVVEGDKGGSDRVSLDHVILNRFESDGKVAIGALYKGGVLTYVGKKAVTIPTAKVATSVAVQGGCVAWTEGDTGHAFLKAAFQSTLVRVNGQVKQVAGRLVKTAASNVVYLDAQDGNRYTFSSKTVFDGWYSDFRSVRVVPASEISQSPLAGNVVYRPLSRLIRANSSKRVYAVGNGVVLHWVRNGDVLKTVYGSDWNKRLDVVPDSMFADYTIGAPIDDADKYYLILTAENK